MIMSYTFEEKQLSDIESLPADSSWMTFCKTDLFGKNFCNFKGRASRSEVWAINIFTAIFNLSVSLLLTGLFDNSPDEEIVFILSAADFILSLLFLLPLSALSVRRCHDINRSGWMLLLIVPSLILPWCRGDRKDNRFGINIYKYEEIQIEDLHKPQNNDDTPVLNAFGKAIFTDLLGNNFFNFHGRASRFEFCTVLATLTLLTIVFFKVDAGLFVFYIIFMICPLLGVISRRFHDLNMRGYWMLLVVPLILLPFARGKAEDNRFGRNIY